MRSIFVDTLFWLALINPRDQWHVRAIELETELTGNSFITTDAVLTEVLNYVSGYQAEARNRAVRFAQAVLNRPDIETVPSSRELFLAGVDLYAARLDKGYSLTDCSSMVVMREQNISEVLTHDRHFAQEGFIVLL